MVVKQYYPIHLLSPNHTIASGKSSEILVPEKEIFHYIAKILANLNPRCTVDIILIFNQSRFTEYICVYIYIVSSPSVVAE